MDIGRDDQALGLVPGGSVTNKKNLIVRIIFG